MVERAHAIDPVDIPKQRAKGWVDFHPETYCHRCGQRNVRSWWVQRELWDAAEGDSFGGGVLCPQCFTELYEARIGHGCNWEVRLDGVQGGMDPASIVKLLNRIEDLEAAMKRITQIDLGIDDRDLEAGEAKDIAREALDRKGDTNG